MSSSCAASSPRALEDVHIVKSAQNENIHSLFKSSNADSIQMVSLIVRYSFRVLQTLLQLPLFMRGRSIAFTLYALLRNSGGLSNALTQGLPW